ncbi:hypothetical protein HPB49_004870 [Dermacentor silvarum]|uniref:Uncharacterized protein n=1 Tax=Dermacentor silvarum TaxID=543639 RepID=A0ACB8DUQ2_DERSI|nr:hypothetical protein HPB49_004870 [Dermacentor silvarum]
MPGLNWAEVDAATVACFSTEFLQTELIRRGIDATGSRDDLIQRLTACLEEVRAAIPKPPRPASARVSSTRVQFHASPLTPTVCQAIPGATSQVYAPASYVPPPPWSYPTPPLVCDAAAVPTQVFSPPQEPQPFVTTPGFVTAPRYPQPPFGVPFSPMSPQYQAPSLPQLQVTTMPDVSSTLPLFENCHKQSARLWIQEIERTQQLTSWSPETTRLIAASKLRGTAKNWHLTLGAQFPTWDTWRKAFLDAFADELTLLQWQQQIMSQVQSSPQSLRDYAYAKLRVIEKCQAPLTEPQKVEYLLHGIQCAGTATSIAAQCPSSVSNFIDICTQLDRAMQHMQIASNPADLPEQTLRSQNNGTTPSRQVSSVSLMPSTAPPTVSSFKKSHVHPSRPASPPHSRRIADLPPAEQEAQYSALSQRYGVPAFRPGQSLSEAVCFKCHEKGHLASKCPTKLETVTQQPATALTSLHAAAPALHTSPLEDVHGSHLECSFFTADIALLGPCDAFPDTGSKITIVTKSAIKNLPLMPWTRDPLAVVGGSSAHPEAQSA